jgi:hypothetical protein
LSSRYFINPWFSKIVPSVLLQVSYWINFDDLFEIMEQAMQHKFDPTRPGRRGSDAPDAERRNARSGNQRDQNPGSRGGARIRDSYPRNDERGYRSDYGQRNYTGQGRGDYDPPHDYADDRFDTSVQFDSAASYSDYDRARSRSPGYFGDQMRGGGSWRDDSQRYGYPFDPLGDGTGATPYRSHDPSLEAVRQSQRGRGPKNYTRSDERIREEINEGLYQDHLVDASEISVDVKSAVVTLIGSVKDRASKHRAEDIADRCSGVKDVDNRLTVLRPGSKNLPAGEGAAAAQSAEVGKKH